MKPSSSASIVHETSSVPTLALFAAELVEAVDAELGSAAPSAEIVERYDALSIHEAGDMMRVETDDGVVEGRFLGFDPHAFLRLQVDGEERRLSTGEILASGS